jgi:hypothetical protein
MVCVVPEGARMEEVVQLGGGMCACVCGEEMPAHSLGLDVSLKCIIEVYLQLLLGRRRLEGGTPRLPPKGNFLLQ